MKPALLDLIRKFNKFVANPLLIHLGGNRFGHFAVLNHVGRKSGRLYRTPLIAEPFGNGFVIALTYGVQTDWCQNVLAKGGCLLRWKNWEIDLVRPEFIDRQLAVTVFPPWYRPVLWLLRTTTFMHLKLAA